VFTLPSQSFLEVFSDDDAGVLARVEAFDIVGLEPLEAL